MLCTMASSARSGRESRKDKPALTVLWRLTGLRFIRAADLEGRIRLFKAVSDLVVSGTADHPAVYRLSVN